VGREGHAHALGDEGVDEAGIADEGVDEAGIADRVARVRPIGVIKRKLRP